jgi:hypothetical protein
LKPTWAKTSRDTISTKKLDVVASACYPRYMEGINRRTVVQASLGKKITKAKEAKNMDQVGHHLPSR